MPNPMHEQPRVSTESSNDAVNVTRSTAARALELVSVDWGDVGFAPLKVHAVVSASGGGGERNESQQEVAQEQDNLQEAVEGIVALFMVRMAAVWDAAVTVELPADTDIDTGEGSDANWLPTYAYSDFSVETICRHTLREGTPWPFLPRHGDDTCTGGTTSVQDQVRHFVTAILGRYDSNLPYHNGKHAYHVVLSVNKLLDLLLHLDDDHMRRQLPPLFGLRRDANLQLALLFAALVHDAGHFGVTNQQLVRESNPVALLYNDTSVQEHNGLALAFQTLLEDRYTALRACMFPALRVSEVQVDPARTRRMDDDAFQRFRSTVISLVLSTDIANPERSQLGKAVFKEAFRGRPGAEPGASDDGEPRRSGNRRTSIAESRRGSITSEISMPRIAANTYNKRYPRRRSSHSSVCSLTSDATSDSVARMMIRGNEQANSERFSPTTQIPSKSARRGSMSSDYDSVAFLHRPESRSPRHAGHISRRLSNDASVESDWTENGMDSIDLRRQTHATNRGANNGLLLHNHQSFSSSNFEGLDDGTPSHSPRNAPVSDGTLENPTPVTSSTPGRALPQERRSASNRHEPNRSRISRRWSTEMSGQSTLTHGGLPPTVERRIRARAQASRLVHEYYGYGDCGKEEDYDDHSSLGEADDNSSLSLTPPSSDDELDGVVITGLTLSSSSHHGSLPVGGAIVIARKKKSEAKGTGSGRSGRGAQAYRNSNVLASRRASTGMSTTPTRHAGCTLNGQIVDEAKSAVHGLHKGADDLLPGKDRWIHQPYRRYSSDDGAAGKAQLSKDAPTHGKRLGIRRSMDLSGESIERFNKSSNHSSRFTHRQGYASERRSSLGAMSTFSAEDGVINNDCYYDYDEPDDLKASVVAELLLRVADVGHYFQRYETMVSGTSQSFRELLRAHAAGRGIDPRPSWFDNQVRIMECYLHPLAEQLEATGVLAAILPNDSLTMGEEGRGGSSLSLVRNLEANRDQWMRQGFEVVASLLQEVSSPSFLGL